MGPNRLAPLCALVALAAACAAAPDVRAEAADKGKPINYSADTGDVNYQTKVGNLSGNVVITQGTMTIRADRIVFRQNADNSVSATAHGNPLSFRQKRDGVDEYFEGFAQRAEYDGATEVLELFDRALLRRGGDEIRSNYIYYNAKSEQFRAEGRPDAAAAPPDAGPGPRVRGMFQPKSGEGKDGGLLPRPGGDGKDAAKAKDAKAAAKDGKAAAKPAEPLPLKPSGELAPKAAK
jgi:lipopolysaccharide export system protein LptA